MQEGFDGGRLALRFLEAAGKYGPNPGGEQERQRDHADHDDGQRVPEGVEQPAVREGSQGRGAVGEHHDERHDLTDKVRGRLALDERDRLDAEQRAARHGEEEPRDQDGVGGARPYGQCARRHREQADGTRRQNRRGGLQRKPSRERSRRRPRHRADPCEPEREPAEHRAYEAREHADLARDRGGALYGVAGDEGGDARLDRRLVDALSLRIIRLLPHEEAAADHPVGHHQGEEHQDDADDDEERPQGPEHRLLAPLDVGVDRRDLLL